MLKALGHPARLRILEKLKSRQFVTATELAEDVSLSKQTVAQHLLVLKNEGLISYRSNKNWAEYFLLREKLEIRISNLYLSSDLFTAKYNSRHIGIHQIQIA